MTEKTKAPARRMWLDPFDVLLEPTRNWGLTWPFSMWPNRPGNGPGAWAPPVDLFEKNGHYVVKVELPGMKKEEITITVEPDGLVLAGMRKEEKEVAEESFHRMEITCGSFHRFVALPEDADLAHAETVYTDGVPEVTLPRVARTTPKAKTLPIG